MLLLFTAVIWGLAFVAQRAGMDYMGAFTFNGVRFLIGALCLMPVSLLLEYMPKRRQKNQGEAVSVFSGAAPYAYKNINEEHAERIRISLRAGSAAGFVLFIAASLQQIGVQITLSAGKAGFITGLYLVLTPVLGMALGRKTRLFTWIGAVTACFGLYLLSAPEGLGSVGSGDLALIGCAFFWAGHILMIDRYAGEIYPVFFAVTQFIICSLLSLICALLFEPFTISAVFAGRVPILYSSLFSVCIAYVLQIVGQRHTAPAKAALIFSTEALFAALGGAVLLGEVMSPRGYVGCVFIFAGIIVSQKR